MTKKLAISHFFMEPSTSDLFDQALELGWQKNNLVQQCMHAFFKVHRDYYGAAALTDCAARGMEPNAYYRVLRDRSIDELQPYVDGRPAFGATPLDGIADVQTGEDFKYRYSPVPLSNYNYVLAQVALLVDMGALTQLVSRIVYCHFEKYWESSYLPQLEADRHCCFIKVPHG